MQVIMNWEVIYEGTELECIAIKSAIELLGKCNSNLILSTPAKDSYYDNPKFEIIGYCSVEVSLK